jgi:hypothetical protein
VELLELLIEVVVGVVVWVTIPAATLLLAVLVDQVL